MKPAELLLRTKEKNNQEFYANGNGDKDSIAQMIFAYLTYHPDLLEKVTKKIMDAVFKGDKQ